MKVKTMLCFSLLFIILACSAYAASFNLFSYTGQASAIAKCTETDKGDDQYTYGSLSYNGMTYYDICSGDNKKMTEYYCSGNKRKQKTYTCKSGCLNGECINCIDSDESISYYKYGVVYLNSYSSKKYKDTCLNTKNRVAALGTELLEYYCLNNNAAASIKKKCNCVNGICILPKLAITVISPNETETMIEVFDDELQVIANTNLNSVCEMGLFRQILSGGLTRMNQTGETYHSDMIYNLEPGINYMLVIGCDSQDGQSLQKTVNFQVKNPVFNGYLGILTDDELYYSGGVITLI